MFCFKEASQSLYEKDLKKGKQKIIKNENVDQICLILSIKIKPVGSFVTVNVKPLEILL